VRAKTCLLAGGFVLCVGLFSATADAAVQNTGPLYADPGIRKSCDLVNISGTPLKIIKIDLIDAHAGTIIETSGPITLEPNLIIRVWNDDHDGFARCRFQTPSTVPASRFRANMSTFRDNGSFWETLSHEIAR